MTNPNKARGTRFESAVVDYLTSVGIPARRLPPAGARDKGDLDGVPAFAVECKDEATLRFSAYVDQANVEAHHAGKEFGVAVVKRRGKGAAQAYAVMDLATLAAVVKRLAEADATLTLLDAIIH